MNTSVDIASIFLTLGGGVASGLAQIAAARRTLRIPMATLLMLAAVAGAFWAEHTFPGLLPLFERTALLVRRAELWRAFTALFMQDGVTGLAFNMTILAVVGIVAEQVLGRRRWVVVYLGAGVITEFLALAWQPHGAGNSIAVFGLAGAITTPGLLRMRHPGRLLISLTASGAALALLLQRDVHGIGFWVGAAISMAVAAGAGQRATVPAENRSRSLINWRRTAP